MKSVSPDKPGLCSQYHKFLEAKGYEFQRGK